MIYSNRPDARSAPLTVFESKSKEVHQGLPLTQVLEYKGLNGPRDQRTSERITFNNAFWPHGPSMNIGHPRDVDPSNTGQPHQVTGSSPRPDGQYIEDAW